MADRSLAISAGSRAGSWTASTIPFRRFVETPAIPGIFFSSDSIRPMHDGHERFATRIVVCSKLPAKFVSFFAVTSATDKMSAALNIKPIMLATLLFAIPTFFLV